MSAQRPGAIVDPQQRKSAVRKGWVMRARALRVVVVTATAVAVAVVAGSARNAAAALPPGNAAQQWDKIAEDTVVGSGAFQGEGFVYMAYVSMAMDRAVSPGERQGQSPDAAVTEAAFRILVRCFPAKEPDLTALHDAALAAIPDGQAKRNGIVYGRLAADKVLRERADDGLQTPIGSTFAVPAARGRTRRRAPYAARVRSPADAMDGNDAAVRARERGPVPAATAPVAAEPAMGRRIQRDQVARRRRQRDADAGPDGCSDFLDRERRPPVQQSCPQ